MKPFEPLIGIINLIPDYDGLPLDLYSFYLHEIRRRLPNILLNKSDWCLNSKPIIILPHQFISGCPQKCAFCPNSGSKCLATPCKNVVDGLEVLSKKYNINCFFFLNSEINISNKYVVTFVQKELPEDVFALYIDAYCAEMKDKQTGKVKTITIYTVIGVMLDWKKTLLGFYPEPGLRISKEYYPEYVLGRCQELQRAVCAIKD